MQVRQKLLVPNQCEPDRLQSTGLSGSLVFRCESPSGPFCLRRWPRGKPTRNTQHVILAAIAAAQTSGRSLLPQIIPGEYGPFGLMTGGYLWQLEHWLPGVADYAHKPTPQKRQSAFRSLAELHEAWSRHAGDRTKVRPSPAIRDRLEFVRRYLQDWPKHTQRVITATEEQTNLAEQRIALMHRTTDALQLHGPTLLRTIESLAAQPVDSHFVLRDIHQEHVLFDNETVSGFVALDAMRVDEPALDLARLAGSMEAFDSVGWMDAINIYRELRPLVSLQRIAAIDYSSCLLSAVQWMEWLVFEQREFPGPPDEHEARWQRHLDRFEQLHWMVDLIAQP